MPLYSRDGWERYRMQQLTENRSDIDIAMVFDMRNSGATLQQIASTVGRTKERIRQILVSKFGSAKHTLISTEQLYRLSGISRYRVIDMYDNGIITPAKEWETSIGRHLLWNPETVEDIKRHLSTRKLCKICNKPVPPTRRIYCSEECYREGHKYKYRNPEGRRKHLECIRKYRAKIASSKAL
jgi:predicted nucleic acid-binding Zn ribbon protein